MKIKSLSYLLFIPFLFFQCSNEKPKTILIYNATIMDGTGSDSYLGSVRIKDKLILEVGDLQKLKTDSIIDGNGLILSPGFIDSHSHHGSDTLRSKDAALSQGITTIIVGQDGFSEQPLNIFLDSITKTPWSINMGTYTGHNSIREQVMGNDFKRVATDSEIEEMASILEAEMKLGSLGLSTGLEYDSGIYSNSEEVIALAKVASRKGGRYISHMRNEDKYLEQSIDEIIRIGKEAKIPVQISHFKLARKGLWGQASGFLQKLDSARTEGIDITADIYPYEYWQSTMTVLFPDRDFNNRATAEYALTELTTPEGMIIGRFDAKPEYENMTLDKIAELRKEDVITTYLVLIEMSQAHPSESIIAKSMDLEDIVTILNWSYTNLCSDGSPNGHPRGWGSFPRYLHMETGQSLETKVNKMTLQVAKNLNIDSIGIIKKGFYADLVLFNPKTIKDNATFSEKTLRSDGINCVFVSGKIVYTNNAPTEVFPGRIIKKRS